jgi:hypothetical protein
MIDSRVVCTVRCHARPALKSFVRNFDVGLSWRDGKRLVAYVCAVSDPRGMANGKVQGKAYMQSSPKYASEPEHMASVGKDTSQEQEGRTGWMSRFRVFRFGICTPNGCIGYPTP